MIVGTAGTAREKRSFDRPVAAAGLTSSGAVEKPFSLRLRENAKMQGSLNPEE